MYCGLSITTYSPSAQTPMNFMDHTRYSFCIQGGSDFTLTPLLFNNMIHSFYLSIWIFGEPSPPVNFPVCLCDKAALVGTVSRCCGCAMCCTANWLMNDECSVRLFDPVEPSCGAYNVLKYDTKTSMDQIGDEYLQNAEQRTSDVSIRSCDENRK